jgi:uncharacterized protein YqgV (UPF0045/DUF77 family)
MCGVDDTRRERETTMNRKLAADVLRQAEELNARLDAMKTTTVAEYQEWFELERQLDALLTAAETLAR